MEENTAVQVGMTGEITEAPKEEVFTDVTPVNAGGLTHLLVQDRTSWDQEQYAFAMQEALITKGLSQWALGMFAYEIKKRWPSVTMEMIAQECKMNVNTLYGYVSTYSQYAKYRPDFIPPDEYSYEFLRLVASQATKQGKDPAGELERLADKGIVENPKAAYKDMKEEETGRALPPYPKFSCRYDSVTTKILINIKGSDETLDHIDVDYLMEQLQKS